MAHPIAPEDMDRRLAELNRRVTRLSRLVAVASLFAIIALALAVGAVLPSSPGEIVLGDPNRALITLSTSKAGMAAITLSSAEYGDRSAGLSILGDKQLRLIFRDTDNRTRVIAGLGPQGEPHIVLSNRDQMPRAVLALRGQEQDQAELRLYDASNRTRILLSVGEQGTPSLQFMAENGEVVFQAP